MAAPATTAGGLLLVVVRASAWMIENLARTCEALCDPARLATIELLRNGPWRAGDLAAALQLTAPAMSRHLRVLRMSGLVESSLDDADARARVYRLRGVHISELRSWLDSVEQMWTRQLAAFTNYAQRTRGRPRRPR